MNDQNKAELRRLAEAATQGKWVTDGDSVNQHDNVIGHYVAHEKGGRIAEAFANCMVRTDAKCRANASFIAAANPAAVLSLLDENEQLRAEAEPLRKDAGRYRWMRDVAPRLLVKSPLIAMCNSDGSVIQRDHGSEMLLSGESADEAVDAVMAKEGSTNG